ncbi:imidazole glycerol phosphate synthase subunit HisH [Enterobacteriaceae endosymbiont of Donacia cincticornis]|uniref:imidazole glycerol phosphate synthase subunit HisH n=1 Tax=Enterobacteriaceae endosymbiont of Donacia cincticornis TaxID=2675773 RepID=UPI00144906D1|nr:imidazole glycerol phosphate synthase subunit HisH [Enterobacteriaceae endosymbiont of Donacia cincticornis]QJC36019.1 imidazole glycerol phosphate synthase subunit HisH [Enterobacteriaceae endosymbiont of Donacia cincticornis]
MKIIIIDTSCGNFYSLKSTIKKLGFNAQISNNKNLILNADKIFLPGVGSARSIIKKLKKDNLIKFIQNCKIDILGICLGMQILGKYSEENEGISTLGIMDYSVNLMHNTYMPIPHMGWNKVNNIIKSPLFNNINNNSYFYFSHSYNICMNNYTIATTTYEKIFSSVIQKKNFFGVQFHPERSGINGIQLIKNFLKM